MDKYVALSNFSKYYTLKNIKKVKFKINLKYQVQCGMKYFNYRMDHILYWIFNIIFSISLKTGLENMIIFRIKKGYYLELLTPEMMQLLGSTERNITKDKNG